jgi:hypothetical protein
MRVSSPPTTCDKAVSDVRRGDADDLAHLLTSAEVCKPPPAASFSLAVRPDEWSTERLLYSYEEAIQKTTTEIPRGLRLCESAFMHLGRGSSTGKSLQESGEESVFSPEPRFSDLPACYRHALHHIA